MTSRLRSKETDDEINKRNFSRRKEISLEIKKIRQTHKKISVNLGSKWASSHDERFSQRIDHNAQAEPIKQKIGLKAAPWKTKSNYRHDFNYYVLMERQIEKAKKYLPT